LGWQKLDKGWQKQLVTGFNLSEKISKNFKHAKKWESMAKSGYRVAKT
jgi:hypothetical protein